MLGFFEKRLNLFLVLCLLLTMGCSRSKESYEQEFAEKKYLGDGTYEQIDSSHYSNSNTEDIDRFIDSPYKYKQAAKKKMATELDGDHSDQIRKVIITNIPQFKQCYIKFFKKKRKGPRGAVTLNFTLNYNGTVQRAGVGESKLSIKIKACLVETVYKLKFPPSPNGDMVRVRQPLRF